MHFRLGEVIAFTVLVFFCAYPNIAYAGNKVRLSSVQTLTLHSDKFTTGRRSSPIPQLRCIDGKSKCVNLPSSVQCYNMGSDGMDVQWKCEAQLPKSTQFDTLQVQCEGYDYPDDPNILAGSCGLSYSLKPSGSGSGRSHKGHKSHSHSRTSDAESVSPIFIIIIIAVCCFAIYAFCLAPSARRLGSEPTAPPPPTYGDNEAFDSPPPYSEGGHGAPQYGFRPEYTDNVGSGGKAYERRTNQQQQQQNYRQTDAPTSQDNSSSGPGFWTGAAVGGLAGYLFGNSSSSNRGGGGGSGGYYRDNTAGYASSSSSSASSVDHSPTTQTGYASTRRR